MIAIPKSSCRGQLDPYEFENIRVLVVDGKELTRQFLTRQDFADI